MSKLETLIAFHSAGRAQAIYDGLAWRNFPGMPNRAANFRRAMRVGPNPFQAVK